MYSALSYCALNALNISTSGRAAKARFALSSIRHCILESKKKFGSPDKQPFCWWQAKQQVEETARRVKTLCLSEKLQANGPSEGQQCCSRDVKESFIITIGSVQLYEERVIWWRQPRGRRPIRVKRLQNEVSAQCLGPWRLFSPREEQVHSKPYRPNPRANKG